MKTLSTALDNHFGSEVTTLAMCWKLVRKDGLTLGFTSHDQDITIDDVFYDSTHTFTNSAISSNSDMSVDNLDVTGVLDADAITLEDLRNGLFNFASIYIFAINWADLSQGQLALRRGWFGEVTVAQNGMFHAELRGLTQALSHNYIESFTPECRADFCDQRCKLVLSTFERKSVVLSSASRNALTVAAFPDVTGSTSVGSHQDWRIVLLVVPNTDHGGFADVQFWDQDHNEITGGTVTTSTNDKHHEGSKARDGVASTNWSTATSDENTTVPIVNAWWKIHFGSAVDIQQVGMTCTANHSESPTSFRIEYSNDGGTTWSAGATFGYAWGTGGESAIWAFGSGVDPINYPDDPDPIDGPTTGASTYIGGMVRFLTGQNRGRSMEIIGADAGAGVITLFENVGYPILPGDSLVISQGCDKNFETCKLYGNAINYRGEPDVPGQDEYLQYPDAS